MINKTSHLRTFSRRQLQIKSTMVVFFVALAGLALPGGSGWTGAVAISPALNPDPTRDSQLNAVAVNASGLAVAAWDQYWYTGTGGSSIGVAVQPAGGKWGTPITVSDTKGFALHPSVAAGADGTLAVAWTYETPVVNPPAYRRIQVAVRPAGAAWKVFTLDERPLGGVAMNNPVPVTIDANGNVNAAWTIYDNAKGHYVVQAATLPAKGVSWSTATLPVNGDGFTPSLSVNANGDAGLAVAVSPYAGYYMPSHAEYFFRSGPNGSWTGPKTVSITVSSSEGYVMNPQVHLDAKGLATVIYMCRGLEGTRQTSGSGWTSPVPVIQASNSVSSYLSPSLAADANGNSIAVVSIFDATINVDRASVWVTRGTADGSWGPAGRLTDPNVPVDAYATQAAVSPDGSLAMVGWIDHYHGNVQVSKLGANGWGAATNIGKSSVPSSFQEILSMDAASGTVARATWKSRSGTQVYAAGYGR